MPIPGNIDKGSPGDKAERTQDITTKPFPIDTISQEEEKPLIKNNESKNNNSIIGTYSIKSGEKFQLFNLDN